MDISLFDNFEDDGQLSMFDMTEDIEKLTKRVEEPGPRESGEKVQETKIRIHTCSCCGRVLFVREEADKLTSFCPACAVTYMQKR